MRRSSAGMVMVIDDEPAIRRMLATIVFEYGCAVATADNMADLERGIREFSPHILFLDIGWRSGDVFALLDRLAQLSFAGAVQIVSGRNPEMVEEVFQAGGALGLRMRRPLAKPFRSESIAEVLCEEGFLEPPELRAVPELGLVSRAWACLSARVGLIDLAIASATRAGPAETPPSPVDQLIWWATREERYREPLLDLPAPAAICIEARVADIPEMMPGLRRTEYRASHPAATIVLNEHDVFADLATARDLLSVLRLCGVTIRLTGCGTRFFSIAGHDPLPIDQAVLGNPLSSSDRVLHRLADLAHRAGTLLMIDGVPAVSEASPLLFHSLDLWREAAQPWRPFVPGNPPLSRPPALRRRDGAWRPVALRDALSIRRVG